MRPLAIFMEIYIVSFTKKFTRTDTPKNTTSKFDCIKRKSIFSQWKFHHFHFLWHLLSALKIACYSFFPGYTFFCSLYHYRIGWVDLKLRSVNRKKLVANFCLPSNTEASREKKNNTNNREYSRGWWIIRLSKDECRRCSNFII